MTIVDQNLQATSSKNSSFADLTLIFMGGLSNGLPGVLTWQTLNLWLYQLGFSKTLIATMFIASLPYNFKFILSPLVELISIPYLSAYYGRKRSWTIFSQFMTIISLLGIAHFTSLMNLKMTFLFCFFTSVFSTLNQIATVSHRIEFFDEKYSTTGISIGITGYRIGKLIGRAGALYLIGFTTWKTTYTLFAGLLILSILAYSSKRDLSQKEPKQLFHEKRMNLLTKNIAFINSNSFLKFSFFSLYFPFIQFKKTFKNWKIYLLLLVSVNLGDDMILGWTDIFLLDLGFDKITIANITKFFGLICSLSGGMLAAVLSRRVAFHTLLNLSLFIHFLAHLSLALLSLYGPDRGLLILIVTLEYFSLGMKAALIATLISYMARRSTLQTGTQYAFFSSVKALPLTILTVSSGVLTDYLSWTQFFLLTSFLSVPALLVARMLTQELTMHFPTDNIKEHLAVSLKAR